MAKLPPTDAPPENQRGKTKRAKANPANRGDKLSAPPRPRGGEARAIADLVPAIGDTAFRKFGFVQSSIITRWPEIIGARLSRVTAPESLRFPKGTRAGGTLHISVTSAHASVVQHVIPDIIARVNRFFGYAAVARVVLRQGRVVPPPRAVTKTPPTGKDATTAPMSDALRAITDPELREVLHGLAQSLDRTGSLPKVR